MEVAEARPVPLGDDRRDRARRFVGVHRDADELAPGRVQRADLGRPRGPAGGVRIGHPVDPPERGPRPPRAGRRPGAAAGAESVVSVLVIDWTTIGWALPTATSPTMTVTVGRRVLTGSKYRDRKSDVWGK